jgi:uncharacterized protein YegP (UPF0339 family)
MLEIFREEGGDWRWHQVAENGQIINGSTEGYKRKAGVLHSLALAAAEFRRSELVVRWPDGVERSLSLDPSLTGTIGEGDIPEPIRAMRLAQTALRSVMDRLDTDEEQELAGEALLLLRNVLDLYDDPDEQP